MTDAYIKNVEIRWSDLDPNFHLRHSVYYDWGAFIRMCFLNDHGITPAVMTQHHIGPILFREEAVFKREIHFGDSIEIDLQMLQCKQDMSRWTMQHHITKNRETLCSIVTISGAWMNTQLRKLVTPPEFFIKGFNAIPKAENFEWL